MLSFIDVFSAVALYAALIPLGTWLLKLCFYGEYEVVGWRYMALSPVFLFIAVMLMALGLVVLALLAFTVMLLWFAEPELFTNERYVW